jgi:hypothetical protein
MSYAGQVWVGLATDQGLVPDPETIVANFHAEFDKLLESAQSIKPAPALQEIPAAWLKLLQPPPLTKDNRGWIWILDSILTLGKEASR